MADYGFVTQLAAAREDQRHAYHLIASWAQEAGLEQLPDRPTARRWGWQGQPILWFGLGVQQRGLELELAAIDARERERILGALSNLLPFAVTPDWPRLRYQFGDWDLFRAQVLGPYLEAQRRSFERQGIVGPVDSAHGPLVGTRRGSELPLQPFRAKADDQYMALVKEAQQERTREHEILVNRFAEWLRSRGLDVGRSQAVDLGLFQPATIFEGKVYKGSWPTIIREAVGQLYEYRYFGVVFPEAALLLLASKQPPKEWLEYLESDRGIGAIWPEGDSWGVSEVARGALPEEAIP